jgi:hypothetical protein
MTPWRSSEGGSMPGSAWPLTPNQWTSIHGSAEANTAPRR